MDHEYIYLVFTRTGTWLSKVICKLSHIEYPHSSISFDDSFTKMYSFGRKNPDNPFSGGFVEENLHEGIFRKYPGCKCLIYKVAVSEEQYLQIREQIKGFLQEKDKYWYNLLGLIGVMINKPIKRKNRYFCSQFVSQLLMDSGVFHSDKVPELIRTDDLLAIENKELIYEGPVDGVPSGSGKSGRTVPVRRTAETSAERIRMARSRRRGSGFKRFLPSLVRSR